MHILDAHAHLASWPDIPRCKENLLQGYRHAGIDACIISHADCSTFPGEAGKGIAPISSAKGLRECLAFAKEHPGKVYVAAWVKPLAEPELDPEFVSLIQDNRDLVVALKLHPFCEQVSPSDATLEPYYNLARKLGLPILCHTALDPNSSIGELVKAAKANPDLRFVAAHLELGSDHRYAIAAIADVPNIYADTAWVDMASAQNAMEILGKNRIFFGTDAPIDGRCTLENPIYVDYVNNAMGLDDATYRKLMVLNACAFYGIPLGE